jgi:hypothetical protein
MPADVKPLFRPEALRPKLKVFTLPPAAIAARSQLADVCEVMGLVYAVFVTSFPNIVPRLVTDATMFKHCPQFRLFLPTLEPPPVGSFGRDIRSA